MLAIDGGTPVRDTPFPQRQPFGDECVELATAAIRSGVLYGIGGQYVERFESEFARLYGAGHTVATSSGTAAIHTALAAVDPEPGSEVVTAPITDGGTIIPILAQGCVPVFADIDPAHYGMDPAAVEAALTDRTVAIIAVHLFGGATDVRALREIADRRGVLLIEDCSQAHATRLHDRYLGRYGHIGAFSLQQSKHMTTGDGGMSITDSPELADRMRLFRDKGWNRKGYGPRSYPFLGMNYRMTELQAAVGIPQLATLRRVIYRRRSIAARITSHLAGIAGVRPFEAVAGCEPSYWNYPFEVTATDPERFSAALAAEGVPTMPGYIGEPIYQCMSALRDHKTFGESRFPFIAPFHDPVDYRAGLCPNAESVLRRLVVFWMHEGLTDTDADSVGLAIAKVARSLPATV